MLLHMEIIQNYRMKGVVSINERKIRRGDIYYANLDPVVGSEQGDCRPVLVVQNNTGNEHSPTVVVTPITGNIMKNSLPTHVTLSKACGLEKDSLVLTEQIRSIDRSRLGNYIGYAGKSAMLFVDRALLICIGLRCRNKKPQFYSLCNKCEKNFRSSGYVIVKKGWQKNKTPCAVCGNQSGLVFGVFTKE